MNAKILIILLIVMYMMLDVDARRGRISGSGVYTERAHYVGMTNNFSRRHREHVNAEHYYTGPNYKLEKTYMPNSSREAMYRAEKRAISEEELVANKHPGGNGPR